MSTETDHRPTHYIPIPASAVEILMSRIENVLTNIAPHQSEYDLVLADLTQYQSESDRKMSDVNRTLSEIACK